MKKLIQNKVAESRLALPAITVYALLVWTACGVVSEGWWLQLGCFMLTTFLMVELNNVHALIRIYSRMVSGAFMVLSCCACMLFPSLREAFACACMAACYLPLLATYQDGHAAGFTYYAFLCFGLASIACVPILYYLPLMWLLMGFVLMSLSWRTWTASLMGLLTPYWFWGCWLLYCEDATPLVSHLQGLADVQWPIDYSALTAGHWIALAFTTLMAAIGTVHYARKAYFDRMRNRKFFACFIWTDALTLLFLLLQPQHHDLLTHLLILNTAPLLAHYISLSSTRLTNVTFITATLMALLITAYNVWTSSSLF